MSLDRNFIEEWLRLWVEEEEGCSGLYDPSTSPLQVQHDQAASSNSHMFDMLHQLKKKHHRTAAKEEIEF